MRNQTTDDGRQKTAVSGPPSVVKVRVGCPAHNCGGRCLLVAHVENGRIIRLDTDDRPDTIAAPQLRACPRGRAYLRRQYCLALQFLCGENKKLPKRHNPGSFQSNSAVS